MQPIAKSLQIRECIFELAVTQATAHIKFPCTFFLEWKTTNGKHCVQSPNRVKANQGVIAFNQQLNLSVLMLYNLRLQHYRKKQSIVLLNLLSNSRPNDPKLVGRFEIDLATIANKNHLNQLTQYPLKYCSVEGSIALKAYLRQQKITNIDPNDLERSECSQTQIFGPEFGSHKEDIKASVSSQNALPNKVKQRIGLRAEPLNLLQALNESKLGSHSQETKSPQIVHIPKNKKQVRIEIITNDNNEYKSQSNGFDVEEGLEKRLKNDFSIPRLVKNSSQFDSSKINSQKTLKNQLSQKSLSRFAQSPKYQQQPHHQFSKKTIQENKIPELSTVNVKSTQIEKEKIQNNEDFKKQSEKLVQTEINNLKQEKEVFEKKLQQLEDQVKTKQSKIEQVLLELAEKSKLIEDKDNILKQQYLKYISQLQQFKSKNKELQQKNRQLMSFKSANYQNQNIDDPDLQNKCEIIQHKYEKEIKNHQNTRMELEQLREWYSQLQQQNQQVIEQKSSLVQRIQQLDQKDNNKQTENDQWQKIKEKYQLQLQNKIEEIKSLNYQLLEKDKIAETIQQQLAQSQLQIQNSHEKLRFQEQKVRSLSDNISELNGEIDLLRMNMQQKQIQSLELSQQLRVTKQSNNELQREIQKYKRISSDSEKQKEQVMEQRQNRLKDLVARMKDKEESIARLQKQKQQVQFKLKQLQFTTEQYKQKLKKQDEDKAKSVEKFSEIQKENKEILRQLQQANRKISQDADNFNKTINKLKQNLEEEVQKRKLTQITLKEAFSSKNHQVGNTKQMEAKISGYLQRQAVLKQNLQIVQNEIVKISEILAEKEQNQQYFNQTIINLNQTNSQLALRISQLQNQLSTSKQRCEALEAQVQLLNSYMPEQQDETQLFEMNIKLNDKNKQLLEIIQQKNRVLNLLQRSEEQNKFSEAKKQLASSRQLKEMADLQNKLVVLEEQNEKAYKELQRLNNKYSQQLNILEVSNEERVKELLSNIQLLSNRIKSLQSKDWQNFNQSKLLKEQFQKVLQSLNEKQFQVEIYKNQIKQHNQTIEGLQSQLNVLNSQYQNVYTQMGQKEFQLYQANAKLKQLQQTKKDAVRYKNDGAGILDEQKKKYQTKIYQIYQIQQRNNKLFNSVKELQIQRQQLRLKVQQLHQYLNKANLQAQTYRSNQRQFEQKINQIQYQQKVVISSLKEAQQKQLLQNERLTQKILQLETEISNLKMELIHSKQSNSLVGEYSHIEVVKQSQPTTPIQQFKQSPFLHVSCQKQNVNLREIVEEITTIINKRKQQEEVEGILRLVIDNNARQEEQFQRWNKQRGAMQQKAKLASKQLQKAKSAIMKNTNRSIAQKSQITSLLRPIEGVIGQLIQLSQTLSELDLDAEQQEEEQLQIDQKQEVRV